MHGKLLKLSLTTIVASITVIAATCTGQSEMKSDESTFNSKINAFTDSILTDLIETQEADSGMIMIVKSSNGHVVAASSKSDNDSCGLECFHKKEYSGTVRIATWLAALNSGNIGIDDTVNTYNGVYTVNHCRLRDATWRDGGYGRISFHDAFVQNSNIATYIAASKAYDNADELTKAILLTGLNIESQECQTETSLVWASLGYNYTVSAWDMLEFINGIANQGWEISLSCVKGHKASNRKRMADRKHIQEIKNVLEDKGNREKINLSTDISTGIVCSSTQLSDTPEYKRYKTEMYGYFPADKPEYTAYICIYKQEEGNMSQTKESLGYAYKSLMAQFMLHL